MLHVRIDKIEAKRKIRCTCPTCHNSFELSLAAMPRVCHMCCSILPDITGMINSTMVRMDYYKDGGQ